MKLNLKHTFKIAERYVIDNSPAIATAIGVGGTIATAILTGKASVKAMRLMDYEQARRLRIQHNSGEEDWPLSKREYAELTWKIWTPPAVAGVLTIAAIVAANRIGSRRAAAVAAAYTLSEKAWGEYKDKVVEQIGEKKEQAVVDSLAQDRVNRNAARIDNEIVLMGDGEQVYLDALSGRTFRSDRETLRKIENDFNHEIINGFGEVKLLSELYDEIGLDSTDYSREVGWDIDNRLEFTFGVAEYKGKAVAVLGYASWPIREYSNRP